MARAEFSFGFSLLSEKMIFQKCNNRAVKFFFSILKEHKIAANDRTNKICFFVK